MKIALVLATLVGVVVCKYTGRIIDGSLAELGQFPWQVGMIFTVGDNVAVCGGSLISKEWVLTAAHCIEGVSYVTLVLGATYFFDEQKSRVTREVKKAVIHEDYDASKVSNDIGLILMNKPVELSDNINIISLPKKGDILQPNTWVTISGFGHYNFGDEEQPDPSPILQWTKVKTISNEDCNADYLEVEGEDHMKILDEMVCTSSSNRRGTCHGDSGGPLSKKDSSGNAVLVGVTSFGTLRSCLAGDPDGYMRTESYLDWIEKISGVTP